MVLPSLVLALGLATPVAAAPRGQNLFIAGDGFTLEQAMGDAEAQRTPLDSPRYRILATGEQVRRLMGVGAAPDGTTSSQERAAAAERSSSAART